MLNYETIISSFKNKMTLMQWLKKVEEALKNASLESVKVEKTSETTAIFTFVFADGSEVVSPALTLPRGERGPEGPRGPSGYNITNIQIDENGHVIVTLEDGTIIDAGTITVEVDDELSPTSENPVQNKVIYDALQGKASLSGNNAFTGNNTHTGTETFNEIAIPITVDGVTKVGKITQVGNYYLAIKVNNDNFALFDLQANAISLTNILPQGTRDIGSSSAKWRDIYISRNISDGSNSITVENITKKMDNPMNAQGDLIVGGSSGTPTKLAKGADGKVLKMVSGAPAWADESGGGGGGSNIGGGYTLTIQQNANADGGNELTIHIFGKDNGYFMSNAFGFHLYSEMSYSNNDTFLNVSFVIIESYTTYDSNFIVSGTLKAYDGTLITNSNINNYLGKILYLTSDVVLRCEGE